MTPPKLLATPRQLARLAAGLYANGPLVGRTIQSLRPYICPFHRLLEFVPADVAMLEIGCGAGLLLLLASATRDIGPSIGFDSNGKAIGLATEGARRLSADGRSVPEFRELDARGAWPEGGFQIVALIDVLHHVSPAAQRSVIERATEKVVPGGRFIYKDIGERPLWRAFMNRLHDLMIAHEWVHYVDLNTVVEWVTARGLNVVHRERINQWWYAHDFVVFEQPSP